MSHHEDIPHVVSLLDKKAFLEAAEEMLTWQPAVLARFYLNHPLCKDDLRQSEFDEVWHKKVWELQPANMPGFHFMPQTILKNIDLFLGYAFHVMAILAEKHNEQGAYLMYFQTAMTHHSIHSYQTCLHRIMFGTSEKNKDALTNMARVLLNWESLGSWHGTPGYLLLVNGYLLLAKVAADLQDDERVQSSWFLVWKYAHLALKCQQYSSSAIHNAYFGQGLALSNPFGCPNINALIDECFLRSKNILNDASRYLAATQAKHTYSLLAQSVRSKGWSLLAKNNDRETDGEQ